MVQFHAPIRPACVTVSQGLFSYYRFNWLAGTKIYRALRIELAESNREENCLIFLFALELHLSLGIALIDADEGAYNIPASISYNQDKQGQQLCSV